MWTDNIIVIGFNNKILQPAEERRSSPCDVIRSNKQHNIVGVDFLFYLVFPCLSSPVTSTHDVFPASSLIVSSCV